MFTFAGLCFEMGGKQEELSLIGLQFKLRRVAVNEPKVSKASKGLTYAESWKNKNHVLICCSNKLLV